MAPQTAKWRAEAGHHLDFCRRIEAFVLSLGMPQLNVITFMLVTFHVRFHHAIST
ncbi:hypothetical protein CPB83DRAFT_864043 [Crepidotus variabilis]|uniref:Uncharacterized protein n=1 Tax=Crepidotus variabilis TaxID=179855 RepID=A0A9P6JJ56_9AGAR|nr:hypothetical protein CPB83DRAFT_864043 [Crepidotus variabilis]